MRFLVCFSIVAIVLLFSLEYSLDVNGYLSLALCVERVCELFELRSAGDRAIEFDFRHMT